MGLLSILATLIVVIPCRDGVLVASDSAGSANSVRQAEAVQKFAAASSRTVVAVTGTVGFSAGAEELRILEVILTEWIKLGDPEVSETSMARLGRAVCYKVNRFLSRNPTPTPDVLCDLIVVQYDTVRAASMVGDILLQRRTAKEYGESACCIDDVGEATPRFVAFFGRGTFAQQQVLGLSGKPAAGARFLPAAFAEWWNGTKSVGDMHKSKATAIADAVMTATELTQASQGDRPDVAGPHRIMFVDGRSTPSFQ